MEKNSKNALKTIRGMRDILPDRSTWWQRMERQLSGVLSRYGYCEIRTPVMEKTSLFTRSIGQETDIVAKEMYTFEDRDGSSLTLRPEGTASVIRSFVEHNLARPQPVNRLYYLGPMFRHERPQKGRYRQFHQMGAELIGSADPAADVELIDLMVECMKAIGLTGASLELNSLGCRECRPGYREKLVAYLEKTANRLCDDCRRRLSTNPLRVLDCKKEACILAVEGAPRMTDDLCPACGEHFELVGSGLKTLDLDFRLNHRMVRGLDYYNRTTFELKAEGLGAQDAVAAGGRYDSLVAELGGPQVPAVGFASGLDRILLKLLDSLKEPDSPPSLFVVTQGDEGWHEALRLMHGLRRFGFKVTSDVRRGSMKSQMKRADKDGARFVLMLGEDELAEGVVAVRDMAAKSDAADKQFNVPLEGVQADLVRRLGEVAGLGGD